VRGALVEDNSVKCFSLVMILLVSTAYADLKEYPHPIVCKPITVVNNTTVIADKNEWITLEWKDFIALAKDKLLFRHMEQIVTVPMKGFLCQ